MGTLAREYASKCRNLAHITVPNLIEAAGFDDCYRPFLLLRETGGYGKAGVTTPDNNLWLYVSERIVTFQV